ncbi:polysaccharide biosynthesis protein [Clostridium tepidiprofundi DSM 19306]|uniref:Polysaccharide biosynthesis protein n=1 Tax=Clostridium tepidiprofundi DSM 19306 TaxID=1121338 RepID=A0A151AU70_9CLOT|nr:hypothetical protein [Clostridium tepidiprofundi]KYH31224.1 polysaccharide biosynthesis protein [Clostridium tepidiprofundi DSM 19306]
MSLIRDMRKVSIAAILSILVGVIQTFFIPKVLSVNQYGTYKEFTLVASYLNILSIGFIDGMYIKYGGRNYKELKNDGLIGEIKFFVVFQFFIFFPMLLIGIYIKKYICVCLAILGFTQNIVLLIKHINKAVGEFKEFSFIVKLESILKLSIVVLLCILFKNVNEKYFIIGIIIPYIIIILINIPKLTSTFFACSKINISNIKIIFSLGIIIMLGNLINNLFFTIDRWFVLANFDDINFAYYSFATSLITLVFVFVSYVSSTFYPRLAKKPNNFKFICKVKTFGIILSMLFISSYFILTRIIQVFLYEYLNALDIIKILFLCIPPMTIILAIYVNLYKASKQAKKYLITVFIMLINASILNVIAILIFNDILVIAVGTTMSYYIWLIYSSKHFQEVKLTRKEYIFIFANIICFLITAKLNNAFLGFIIYLSIFFSLVCILFSQEIRTFTNIGKLGRKRPR